MARILPSFLKQPAVRVVLLLLTLISIIVIWLVVRTPTVDALQVQVSALSQSVVSTGRITSPARIAIGSQVTATIDSVTVQEGQNVQAGDTLVELRASDADAALQLAHAQLEQARQQQIELKEVQSAVNLQKLRKAQADLKLAQADHQRALSLVKKQVYSQAYLETSHAKLQAAQTQLSSLKTEWQATQKGGARYALVAAQVEQAKAQLTKAKLERAHLTLRAPVAGQILSRFTEPGNVVQAGTILLQLAQSGETRIYASLDEKNLPLLREGMPAKALADAFSHQPFDAQLYFISPSVDAQRSTVELRFRVPKPPKFLRPDMTVSVQIIVAQQDAALVLPANAIRARESTQPWVLAIRDGKTQRVPVKVGLVGIGMIQIQEGLQKGEWVIPPSSSAIAGQRLNPRALPEQNILNEADKNSDAPPSTWQEDAAPSDS